MEDTMQGGREVLGRRAPTKGKLVALAALIVFAVAPRASHAESGPESTGLAASTLGAPSGPAFSLTGSPSASVQIDAPIGRGVQPSVSINYAAGARGVVGSS